MIPSVSFIIEFFRTFVRNIWNFFAFGVYFLFVALFLSQIQGKIEEITYSIFSIFFQNQSHTVIRMYNDVKGRSHVTKENGLSSVIKLWSYGFVPNYCKKIESECDLYQLAR